MPAVSHASALQTQRYKSITYAAVMSQPLQQHYLFNMEKYPPYASNPEDQYEHVALCENRNYEQQKCMNSRCGVPIKAKANVT